MSPARSSEEAEAEDALREPRHPLADREVDAMRLGQLLGDLHAGVPCAHHEHVAGGELRRIAVRCAVELYHAGRQVAAESGDDRLLERSGRHHHLRGLVAPALGLGAPSRRAGA
jgi:hypothetical protein